MKGGVHAYVWLAAVVALVCVAPARAPASQFLSAEIDTALANRGVFFKKLELPEENLPNLDEWLRKNGGDGNFKARLDALRRDGGAWHRYVSGVASDEEKTPGARERFFEEAVKSASADPGTLWLLALEFIRGGHTEFAGDCFDAIETCVFSVGGSAAPLLSQQLILFGNTLAASDPETAGYCYDAARRFDKNQCWWLYRKAATGFPGNAATAIPGFVTEALGLLGSSWRAQAALVCWAYRFFAATAFIFALTVLAVFAVKYLGHGVHPVGDTLFVGASPRARTAASVVIVLAMFMAGVVPTLWIIAFLICRFMGAGEKKLLILVCAILALSPLNFFVDGFLSRGISPDSPAVLLERSIREGYSVGLYRLAKTNLSKRPGNYATDLALAVCATKSEGYGGASPDAVGKALDLAPNDHIALLYAGNYAFLTGDIDGMKQYYGAVLKDNPRSPEAKFNLAQAYVNDGGFTAPDMISEAAKINAGLVGGHMRINARLFGDDVPPLRRVIQPALTPLYFWTRLFIADPAEILRFNDGKTCFGMSPLTAFGASAILMLAFLCFYSALWKYGSKTRKYFTCRICGRLLCRRCRKGTICSVCYKKSMDSHNNAATMYNLQKAYQDKALLRNDFMKFAVGVVIPGAGELYKGETVFKPATAMLITSAVAAACYCAITFHTFYPNAAVIDPIYCVPVLLLYFAVSFLKQCVGFAKTMKVRAKMSVRGN